jgi:hypothetical protein
LHNNKYIPGINHSSIMDAMDRRNGISGCLKDGYRVFGPGREESVIRRIGMMSEFYSSGPRVPEKIAFGAGVVSGIARDGIAEVLRKAKPDFPQAFALGLKQGYAVEREMLLSKRAAYDKQMGSLNGGAFLELVVCTGSIIGEGYGILRNRF